MINTEMLGVKIIGVAPVGSDAVRQERAACVAEMRRVHGRLCQVLGAMDDGPGGDLLAMETRRLDEAIDMVGQGLHPGAVQ